MEAAAPARPADAVLPELRQAIAHLASFERPSASEGERRAAEWIAERLRAEGCRASVEAECAHGGYWWPLGLLTGLAGAAALSGRRAPSLVAGVIAAAGIADDTGGGRLWFRRRFLPARPTHNVVAEAGDTHAARTVLVVAHHDAAHWSLLFTPAFGRVMAERFPRLLERTDSTPPVMAPVVAGPLVVALWGLLGRRPLRAAGAFLSLGSAATFAEIGSRAVVPGANDNLSGVATLLGLARLLRERPVRGVRVLLLSTGSEESFMEGMQAFARRHFPELPRDRTHVVCVDTVGSPELVQLEGEGMLRMRWYPTAFKDVVSDCAARAGVHLRRGLRFRNATDGLVALRAGYPTVMLGSVDPRTKLPTNYHWPTDVPEHVDGSTVADAVTLCDAIVRRLAADG
jgi:hypothetical protein